ncbi:MAG TPA: DUF4405 domain-containing protein [Planctomycetota bacterium]|nr:DUF4405 domain-containing protein [Planctomycetota bacterium]HRR79788.1 DUF4405 domain-containing protein [Planctomycetota bacterium]HRT95816.1 DUF4405 domain-containing protein [Planctomycetota bacterium]
MPKNKLHLVVNVLAYLAMVGLAATGLILYYRLPPGSGSMGILGYSRHQWGTVHFYLALSLVGLVTLHVALHWKWVTNTFGSLTRPRAVRKAGAGAGGALLLLALGLAGVGAIAAPWLLPVGAGTACDHEGEGGKGKGYRGGKAASACDTCTDGLCPTTATMPEAAPAPRTGASGPEHGPGGIKGSTTLAEVAAEAGVPFERIVAELKLPAGTPSAATLGRLRQQHGFSMQDIRALVTRLKQERAGAAQ